MHAVPIRAARVLTMPPRRPQAPREGRVISTATLLKFAIFDINSDGNLEATLPTADGSGSLTVIDDGMQYHVVVDDEEVARVDDFLASAIQDPPHILMPSRSSVSLATMEEFETPDFGVTVLGSADGFTADGTTAGFVLWMRGRGILIDPPAHSAHYLRENGISSRKITHVILTHCHADHDAGTFQKILLEQRVTVMTTKTIMASFIRKYALVSDMPEDFLLRLFVFHSVKIAEPVHFQGGTLTFFYSLHALPCIGFRAELAGKSITYSGDTFYDPEGLMKMQEAGIISDLRRKSLLHDASVQASDLLLHEAGVPPIHTPPSALKALPEEIYKNLRVIHINNKRAAEAGLTKVQAGFEHTIRVPVEVSQHALATNILQILLATDLFRHLDVNTAIEVLQVTQERTYNAGCKICSKGESGDFLRIIKCGTVLIERDGAPLPPLATRLCTHARPCRVSHAWLPAGRRDQPRAPLLRLLRRGATSHRRGARQLGDRDVEGRDDRDQEARHALLDEPAAQPEGAGDAAREAALCGELRRDRRQLCLLHLLDVAGRLPREENLRPRASTFRMR